MHKQLHRASIPFSQGLISITGAGIIAFSLLTTGYTERSVASNQEASPKAVAKRIAPVGAVNVASASKEGSKAAVSTTPTQTTEKSPQKSEPTSKEADLKKPSH